MIKSMVKFVTVQMSCLRLRSGNGSLSVVEMNIQIKGVINKNFFIYKLTPELYH